MKKLVPRIYPFDNRSPDKHVLYPMPMPEGVRAVAFSDGTNAQIHQVEGERTVGNITGFAPHIEETINQLYRAMMSEPLPGITENGQQKYFPGVAFDLVLHDRKGKGEGTRTIAALDDWCLDDEWPVDASVVCAFVMATMPLTSFNRGTDDVDLWMRRSHLMRGCMRIGMANPHAHPHPIIRPATLAPDSWASPAAGCAGRPAGMFWQQVDNCFKHGYVGCLIIDVMQPWSVRGDHYQLITEEDFL